MDDIARNKVRTGVEGGVILGVFLFVSFSKASVGLAREKVLLLLLLLLPWRISDVLLVV